MSHTHGLGGVPAPPHPPSGLGAPSVGGSSWRERSAVYGHPHGLSDVSPLAISASLPVSPLGLVGPSSVGAGAAAAVGPVSGGGGAFATGPAATGLASDRAAAGLISRPSSFKVPPHADASGGAGATAGALGNRSSAGAVSLGGTSLPGASPVSTNVSSAGSHVSGLSSAMLHATTSHPAGQGSASLVPTHGALIRSPSLDPATAPGGLSRRGLGGASTLGPTSPLFGPSTGAGSRAAGPASGTLLGALGAGGGAGAGVGLASGEAPPLHSPLMSPTPSVLSFHSRPSHEAGGTAAAPSGAAGGHLFAGGIGREAAAALGLRTASERRIQRLLNKIDSVCSNHSVASNNSATGSVTGGPVAASFGGDSRSESMRERDRAAAAAGGGAGGGGGARDRRLSAPAADFGAFPIGSGAYGLYDAADVDAMGINGASTAATAATTMTGGSATPPLLRASASSRCGTGPDSAAAVAAAEALAALAANAAAAGLGSAAVDDGYASSSSRSSLDSDWGHLGDDGPSGAAAAATPGNGTAEGELMEFSLRLVRASTRERSSAGGAAGRSVAAALMRKTSYSSSGAGSGELGELMERELSAKQLVRAVGGERRSSRPGTAGAAASGTPSRMASAGLTSPPHAGPRAARREPSNDGGDLAAGLIVTRSMSSSYDEGASSSDARRHHRARPLETHATGAGAGIGAGAGAGAGSAAAEPARGPAARRRSSNTSPMPGPAAWPPPSPPLAADGLAAGGGYRPRGAALPAGDDSSSDSELDAPPRHDLAAAAAATPLGSLSSLPPSHSPRLQSSTGHHVPHAPYLLNTRAFSLDRRRVSSSSSQSPSPSPRRRRPHGLASPDLSAAAFAPLAHNTAGGGGGGGGGLSRSSSAATGLSDVTILAYSTDLSARIDAHLSPPPASAAAATQRLAPAPAASGGVTPGGGGGGGASSTSSVLAAAANLVALIDEDLHRDRVPAGSLPTASLAGPRPPPLLDRGGGSLGRLPRRSYHFLPATTLTASPGGPAPPPNRLHMTSPGAPNTGSEEAGAGRRNSSPGHERPAPGHLHTASPATPTEPHAAHPRLSIDLPRAGSRRRTGDRDGEGASDEDTGSRDDDLRRRQAAAPALVPRGAGGAGGGGGFGALGGFGGSRPSSRRQLTLQPVPELDLGAPYEPPPLPLQQPDEEEAAPSGPRRLLGGSTGFGSIMRRQDSSASSEPEAAPSPPSPVSASDDQPNGAERRRPRTSGSGAGAGAGVGGSAGGGVGGSVGGTAASRMPLTSRQPSGRSASLLGLAPAPFLTPPPVRVQGANVGAADAGDGEGGAVNIDSLKRDLERLLGR